MDHYPHAAMHKPDTGQHRDEGSKSDQVIVPGQKLSTLSGFSVPLGRWSTCRYLAYHCVTS